MASPNNPRMWNEYCLLVSVAVGRDFYSHLCMNVEQKEILEWLKTRYGPYVSVVSVEILSTDSVEFLEDSYRNNGMIIAG